VAAFLRKYRDEKSDRATGQATQSPPTRSQEAEQKQNADSNGTPNNVNSSDEDDPTTYDAIKTGVAFDASEATFDKAVSFYDLSLAMFYAPCALCLSFYSLDRTSDTHVYFDFVQGVGIARQPSLTSTRLLACFRVQCF
jgi:hypothetical protein